MILPQLRITRGKDDAKNARKYVERARKQIIFETAAQAWSSGVPWAEAIKMSTEVMQKADPAPKAVAKGKAKAKGRPR